jgi:hypothetical protein
MNHLIIGQYAPSDRAAISRDSGNALGIASGVVYRLRHFASR